MPGKSKQTDTAAHLTDDAIRQRAYFLWEKDGRPEGRDEHYWRLAHDEAHSAHQAMVEDMASRTAKATKGKNPAEMPASVKNGNKASKLKVKAADKAKAKPVKPGKATDIKKPPKPRAAIQKSL
jgi:hypothetical protein